MIFALYDTLVSFAKFTPNTNISMGRFPDALRRNIKRLRHMVAKEHSTWRDLNSKGPILMEFRTAKPTSDIHRKNPLLVSEPVGVGGSNTMGTS